MPFLADASAELQGRALGEVCSFYAIAHDSPRHDAPAAPAADHAGDHCVLNALGALATGDDAPSRGIEGLAAAAAEAPPAATPPRRSDATAAWVARRKQGPPELA